MTRTTESGCVVCGGSPTVRSHLFPRALVHRLRGNEKTIIEGDRARPGYRLSQSGLWDDNIVCAKHEGAFSTADDYIVRFTRKFERVAILSDTRKSYRVPNPRPDLLTRFAAATIWRHAVSKHGFSHGLELGPYRQIIERHLFADVPLSLEMLVGRSNLIEPSGTRVEIGLAPYKKRLLRWTIWHFSIGGFDFYVKTDQRRFPREWQDFLANDNDPLTLPLIDPLRLDDVPMFQPIFAQMFKFRSSRSSSVGLR